LIPGTIIYLNSDAIVWIEKNTKQNTDARKGGTAEKI
jgi:hypothetical protein